MNLDIPPQIKVVKTTLVLEKKKRKYDVWIKLVQYYLFFWICLMYLIQLTTLYFFLHCVRYVRYRAWMVPALFETTLPGSVYLWYFVWCSVIFIWIQFLVFWLSLVSWWHLNNIQRIKYSWRNKHSLLSSMPLNCYIS